MSESATHAQIVTFAALLEPVTVEEFLREVSGRRPLHVQGGPQKFGELFSWAEFNRLLNMSKLWSDRSMKLVLDGRDVPPESYSVNGMTREGNRALLPEPAKVEALLRRGATIILDLVETLSPGIGALTRALTAGTGSVVVCNAYCSFKSHQGFMAHFDTTDVFALHIEGSKVWRIYEGVAEHPVDLPGHHFSSLTPEQCASARGAVAMEVEMKPGDLLYVPRGQYHEALASSDASLHLSFGANRATGLDFVSLLSRWIADDPRFRASLPHFDDTEGLNRHLFALGEALGEWIQSPQVAARAAEWQRARAFRDGIHEFGLPAVASNPRFHVRRVGMSLESTPEGGVLITASARLAFDPKTAELLRALLSFDFFDRQLVASLIPEGGPMQVDALIKTLVEAGAVEPV